MNNRSGSKSTLFLMEQLIVILIFSFCAAVCVKIFVVSYIMVSESNDMTNALRIAQSGAECYKAYSGDAEQAAKALGGGTAKDNAILVYYDKNWRVCEESDAAYTLKFAEGTGQYTENASERLLFSDISVEKITGGEITSFTVAAIGRNVR